MTGIVERGERVEKACSQPAEAAVAEARLGLFVGDRFEIETERAECLFGFGSKAEVQEIVFEMGSEEVFSAEEGEDSNILLTVAFDGLKPLVHEAVAYDGGQAVILLERRGTFERLANGVNHVVPERYCDLLGGGSGAVFIAYGVGLLLFEVRGVWLAGFADSAGARLPPERAVVIHPMRSGTPYRVPNLLLLFCKISVTRRQRGGGSEGGAGRRGPL